MLVIFFLSPLLDGNPRTSSTEVKRPVSEFRYYTSTFKQNLFLYNNLNGKTTLLFFQGFGLLVTHLFHAAPEVSLY